MLTLIEKTLQASCPISRHQLMVVGVSGGKDSISLAHKLSMLGYNILIAHFNHKLRSESAHELRSVQKFCKALTLPFEFGEGDVLKYSKGNNLSIEEAARELRYQFLFQVAQKKNAGAVAVAHNANDQVETVLMHLLRGAGVSGLKGMQACSHLMQYSQTIPLWRPLLTVWRTEINEYVRINELEPTDDPSNTDLSYLRNRIRHDLIPELESYNPKISEVIWRMSQVLAGDEEILGLAIDEAWHTCVKEHSSTYVSFSIPDFLTQPVGLQRGLFRRAISKLRSELRDIDFDSIERAIDFVSQSSETGRIDFTARLYLLREGDTLWLADWNAELPNAKWPQLIADDVEVDIPGERSLCSGWIIRVVHVEDVPSTLEQAYANTNPYQIWVDAKNIGSSLIIRVRNPGERFEPLGMDGHSMKLSDFLINEGMPARLRDAWPLVCFGEDIVWIPGSRISHQFRITDKSNNILFLSMEKQGQSGQLK